MFFLISKEILLHYFMELKDVRKQSIKKDETIENIDRQTRLTEEAHKNRIV